jgi:tetratricopeptide (TPR) repeat protein
MAVAMGAAYSLGGRIADALPLLNQAMEQAMATARIEFQVLCGLALGEAQALAGRLEEAQALAARVLALACEHRERGTEAYALRLLGEIAAQRGPLEAALAATHYCQSLALTKALGMRPFQAHCHRGLGMLYTASGQRVQARAALSTAINLYRALEMTF